MKTRTSFALVAVFGLGLLGSCTINPHPMDMSQAVQSAKTRADHDALVTHYEAAAKEMQAKVDEHKKLLAQYEARKSLYGKQAQSLISHCQGLIRVYEQATKENLSMAQSHREAAAEAK
jgi:hypothetical protein